MPWSVWPGLIVAILATSGLAAQTHYRSLDGDRPTRIRDAFPIERYAIEAGASLRFVPSGSSRQLSFDPELEYGVARGVGIGIGVAGRSEWGAAPAQTSSRVGAFVERNILRETPALPAVAIRFESSASLRDGPLGGAALGSSVAVTRSFGAERIHLNAGWTFAAPGRVGPAESLDRWFAGFGVDRTLIRSSLLLVGEVVAARSVGSPDVETTVATGIRRQMTPTVVGSVGAGLTLGDGPARVGITVSWSRVFGWSSLMPGRRR